jgi:hypothetical protein
MSNELIIEQLKNREAQLLTELNKVRIALTAFLDDAVNFNISAEKGKITDSIPVRYDETLTYASKILYVLNTKKTPMLVDEIAEQLLLLEPGLIPAKLHKSVGHNISMLAKYGKVRKHPFSRKIKYSL